MRVLGVLLILAACEEPAIDLSFDQPDELPAGYDMSCATAVNLVALGNERGSIDTAPDFESKCIDLARGPTTFDDLESLLRGKVDIPLPESGLAGLTLVGFAGSCASENPFHEAVFYGGAPYAGGGMRVQLETNVSCASGTMLAARTIDMLALSNTGTCTSMPSQMFPGTIRPLLLGDDFPLMTFEFGTDFVETATGIATLRAFSSAGPHACVSVGAQTNGTVQYGGGSCVNAQAAKLCGSELEVAALPFSFANRSRDDALLEEYGEPVIGGVFTKPLDPTAPRTPIANATVTVGGEATNARIVYAAPDGTQSQLVPTGGASTNATGFFLVYMKGMPTQISVAAPGHKTQTFTVASSLDWPSTLAVGLEPL